MTLSRFKFCGQPISKDDLAVIREVIDSCGLNRTELALTICEIMDWTRPNGKLKRVECMRFLDKLSESGLLKMPKSLTVRGKERPPKKAIPLANLKGTLREFGPVSLEVVNRGEPSKQWKLLIDTHHYLGFKKAYGANLRYFIKVSKPEPLIVGCLQFSSPAWRVDARDRFLGWNKDQREVHLQKVVQNSRFLILPTVSIKGLASHTLSIALKRLPGDWKERYAIGPWWCETFVDTTRFKGTCYQASNWLYLGDTVGRGRQDRNKEFAAGIKGVWIAPMKGKNTKKSWTRLICPV